jgi:hypothetical protein
MTALPLLLVGAVVWWVRRQFARSERAGLPRAAHAPEPPGAHVRDDAPHPPGPGVLGPRASGLRAGLRASR